MTSAKGPKSVLVVDDDQDIVLVLEAFLKESGYDVDVAYDGMDALASIRAHNYDAVICDMMMPRMSGEDLYREVERTAPWMSHRFLFVTGMARVQDYGRFFSQVNARSIEKPFHAEDVLQIISEIVAENKE
jgi:DNA-binding NtrC family response regulator